MADLNIIQRAAVCILFLYSVGFAGYNLWSKKATVAGTGGTVILPLLIIWLILASNLGFYFSQNYLVQIIGFIIFISGILFVGWAIKHLGKNIDDFWTARKKREGPISCNYWTL